MTLLLFIPFALAALSLATRREPREPMPGCPSCSARFLSPRGVDLHRAASHPETFEDVAVRPEGYR